MAVCTVKNSLAGLIRPLPRVSPGYSFPKALGGVSFQRVRHSEQFTAISPQFTLTNRSNKAANERKFRNLLANLQPSDFVSRALRRFFGLLAFFITSSWQKSFLDLGAVALQWKLRCSQNVSIRLFVVTDLFNAVGLEPQS